jgi:hypothetical protein
MALAFVLFVISWVAPAIVGWPMSVPQAATANGETSSQNQEQPSGPPANQPSSQTAPASGETSAGKTSAPATHPRRRRNHTSNCGTLPAAPANPQPEGSAKSSADASGTGAAPSAAANSGAASSSTPGSATSTSGASQPDAASSTTAATATRTTKTASNCPPPKNIVRQGGTKEPSIQLAGGTGADQASQKRPTAREMLGATTQNLKKISSRQLNANQQDEVAQIHQFMDQSKAATAAGDLDRARTLAWKAQMLSEALANPGQ